MFQGCVSRPRFGHSYGGRASGIHVPLGSSVWVIRPDWQNSFVQPVDASIGCLLRIRSISGSSGHREGCRDGDIVSVSDFNISGKSKSTLENQICRELPLIRRCTNATSRTWRACASPVCYTFVPSFEYPPYSMSHISCPQNLRADFKGT